jgi:hypothetical protein
MTHSRLGGLITHLPDRVTEIYRHPGTSSDFEGTAPNCCYEEELAALTSADLRRQILEAGVESGGFSDAARRRQNSVSGGAANNGKRHPKPPSARHVSPGRITEARLSCAGGFRMLGGDEQ